MHFPPRGVAVRGAMSTIAAVASAAGGPSCYYLITDFDGTCTQKDTTPLVPHLAARSSSTPDEVLERFNALEDLYMSMVESVQTGLAIDKAVKDENKLLDMDGLTGALTALDAVSDAVTLQLSDSGILKGIADEGVAGALAEWREAGTPIKPPELRPGCAATLAAAAADGWRLGVLTLNWCPALVRAYLPLLAEYPDAPMWSNSIDVATGYVNLQVNGAVAKREIIAKLVKEAAAAAEQAEGGKSSSVVYVGDSSTDLLALCAADVGILIGESQSTRKIAKQFALKIEPLPASVEEAVRRKEEGEAEAMVFEVESWNQLRRSLKLET